MAILKRRDVSVLVVKSSHHHLEDRTGSDSDRHLQAGADGVAYLTATGTQLFLDPPLTLEELLPAFACRYKVALVEGGKGSSFPKVELLGGLEPLLSADQVVEQLERGASGCSLAAERFLELLQSRGQSLG